MIRLYRAPFSTNVERVALALAHKGLAVESVVISYDDRSEVERVSGQGLVPVIEDEGRVVFDSTAILEYLEDAYPEPSLYPADPARRAETRLFIDWFNRVWKGPPNEIEDELVREVPDQERIRRLRRELAGHLDRFEELLAGRSYLMGEFSAADCAAYPFLKYALGREEGDDELFHRILEEGQPLTDGHRQLAAWLRRMAERPRA